MRDEKAAFPPEWDIMLDSRHWEWIAARIGRWGGTVDRTRGLIRWSRYWIWRNDATPPPG